MFFIFIKIRAVVDNALFTLILNLIFHCISSLRWSCMSSHTLKFEGSWLQTFKDSIRLSLSRLKVLFFTSDLFLFHVLTCPGKQIGFALNHIDLNQVSQKLTIDKSENNPNQIIRLTHKPLR